jgi:hypothetical protein
MNRKYENTHCGNNGISSSAPYIPIVKLNKNKNDFNRESQKAYKDLGSFLKNKN